MDRNWEQDAQKQGWKPKEDFVAAGGNEETWVDAKVFVERGESSAPILKSKLEKSERQLSQLSATVESLTKHHNRMLQKETEEKKRLVAELEDARAQAVADGNARAFKQADQQLNRLRQEVEQPREVPVHQGPDPVVEEWLQENAWYNDDEKLQAMADGFAAKLKTQNPNLVGRELLDKVAAKVKLAIGEEKKAQKKVENEEVEGEEEEVEKAPPPKFKKRTAKKGFSDLPKSDQRECDRLVREIEGFTREQFLEYYDWTE